MSTVAPSYDRSAEEPETDAGEPSPQDAMTAAKPPVGTGSAPLFAQLLALALIALGAVGIQEVLVRTGVISPPSWISSAVDAVDGVTATVGVLILGAVLIVVGLLLLAVVFRPRPRKAVALSADTGVYLRTGDLGRIAESVLAGVEGVTGVDVKATRKKLHVTATTVAGKERNASIVDDVRARLAPVLDALERAPRVSVAVQNEGL